MEAIREITTRKSAMAASDIYDYKKIMYPRQGFLECGIREDREEIVTAYQVNHLLPMVDVRREKREVRLGILMDALNLYECRKSFNFSLNPENLYYDRQQRVYVMERDVYPRGEAFHPEDFLNQIKALIGYCMQDRFGYEDYRKGGEKLLMKNGCLKQFYQLPDLETVKECLWNEYQNEAEETAHKKVLVNKTLYQKNALCFGLMTMAFLAVSGFLLYQYFWILPYHQAVIEADQAYLDSDYVHTIDALDKVDITRMDIHQKYMLAVSYIKGEDLSDSQKNNILPGLSLNGTEKQIDYWIYLGRLEVSEAENIALQISDDQLLLYAYLKEKLLIETNTKMSGEEKLAALSEIEAKIDPLAEKYKIEE